MCWGRNTDAQLTRSHTFEVRGEAHVDMGDVRQPLAVTELPGPVGYLNIFRHSNAAIMADDNLEANGWGKAGLNLTGWFKTTAQNALFVQIELTPRDIALLRADGTASLCSGNNPPICDIALLHDVEEVAAEGDDGYFVMLDGTVAIAHWDSGGAMSAPILCGPPDCALPPLSNVLEIRTAQEGYQSDPGDDPGAFLGPFLCARHSNGHVDCWGEKAGLLLGAGAPQTPIVAPAEIPGIEDATQLSVGTQSGCVLTAEKEVRCFGRDLDGVPLNPAEPIRFGDGSAGSP